MADKSESGTLEDDEFVLFYKMLTQREEVLAIFRDFSTDGQTLSVREMERFLQEGQLEQDDTQRHAIELIQRYEPSEAGTLQRPLYCLHAGIFIFNRLIILCYLTLSDLSICLFLHRQLSLVKL